MLREIKYYYAKVSVTNKVNFQQEFFSNYAPIFRQFVNARLLLNSLLLLQQLYSFHQSSDLAQCESKHRLMRQRLSFLKSTVLEHFLFK